MDKQNSYWNIVLLALMDLFQEQVRVLNSHDNDKHKLYLLKLNLYSSEVDLIEAVSKYVTREIFTHSKVKKLPHNKQRFFLPKNRIEVVFHLN